MYNPFFSIILPTYNRANFLFKAINSVIGQTFTDWELIIIDDGSTDNTKDIIESIKEKTTEVNNKIIYIYQTNQERSVARNNGIVNSKGQYICFLDSDDYFLENHLQYLYDEISAHGFPVSFFYALRGFETKEEIKLPPLQAVKVKNNLELIFNIMIATPQVCIHKDILNKHKFDPKFRIGEDLELWSRIINEYQLININKHTVISREHDESSVSYASGNFFIENLKVVRYIFGNKDISSKISLKQKHISISNCFFGIARYYLLNHKRLKAIYNLFISIVYYPLHKQTKYRLNLIIQALIKK